MKACSISCTRFFFVLFTLFFTYQTVLAYQGEMKLRILIPANEKANSDLYLLGWRVDVEGEVNGSLFVLGGNVRVHGPIHGNVFLAGGTVEVDGPVDGDVNLLGVAAESKAKSHACRLLGLDATHSGKTIGDLLALGAMVDAKDQVGGDTVVGGGEVRVAGTHQKNLVAVGHDLEIAGKIKGDSKIKADTIKIEKSAFFGGNLVYTSSHDLENIAQNVKGNVVHNFPPPRLPHGIHFPWLYVLSRKIFSALWLTVVGLVSLMWFPRSSQSVVDTMLHFPWESFFTGLALFIAIPGIALILVVSLLGIPLGIFLFIVFAIGIYLTRLFGSLYLGERLLGALEHHVPPYWQSLPLGVFLFTVLTSIPYIGIVVSVVVIPLALGAKALLGWRVYRRMRHRHLA